MNSESNKYEAIFCADDDEYRVNCEICDRICIASYYKNHLNSGTHIKKFPSKTTNYQYKQLKLFFSLRK